MRISAGINHRGRCAGCPARDRPCYRQDRVRTAPRALGCLKAHTARRMLQFPISITECADGPSRASGINAVPYPAIIAGFRLRIAIRHTLARVPRPIRNCRAPGHETLHQQELPARLRSSGSPGTGCCGERRRAGRFGRCVSSAALSLWSPPCGSPGCAVSTYRSLSFARSFSVSCYLSGADDSSWLRCRRCTVVGSGYGSRSASRVLRDRDLRVRAGI